MKYTAMIAIVVLAFLAGTQISSAQTGISAVSNTTNTIQASLTENASFELLIPDSANRMMAYHRTFTH